MARLPQPGADDNVWGAILNEYLTTSHTASGELKPNVIGSDQLADDAITATTIASETITEDKLDPDVQAKLNMNAGTPALNDLTDVTISTAINGQTLVFQSGSWVNSGVSGGVTDHGALTGLADDDHTQYLNNTRGDARYYTQSAMDTALAGKAATSHTHTASQISDSTVTGRSLLSTTDASMARGTLGLGNVDNTSDATKNAATVTLTNKTISGANNTLTSIPQSAVTNLSSDLASKQTANTDLAAIAALTPVNDDLLQRKAGAWTNRTPVQLKADLGLAKADVGLGNVDNTSDATKNAATVTLTNKTMSGASNTFSNIPQGSVTNLTSDLAGKAATSHTHTASQISDSTAIGRAVLVAVDAAAARTAIGAGTSNLIIGTTSTTAKAGDYAPTKADVGLGNVDNTSDATKNSAAATLTNKTISGASNTLSNIPQSAVTNLTSDLASKQGSNADLAAIAALTPLNDDILQRKAGAWTNRTPIQVKADLALVKADVGLSNVDNTSDATKNAATVTLTNKTISGASNTLSNIPESAVTNLTTDLAGKASTSHTHTASQISDSTTVGRSVLTATDAAAARSAIGAGTSSLVIGTTSITAKAGDYAPTKTDVGLGNVDNTSDATKNAAAVTLTNKTISGSSNTLSNIPQSAVTNLTTTYIARNVYDTGSAAYPTRPSVTYVEWVGSVDPGASAQNGDTWVDTST